MERVLMAGSTRCAFGSKGFVDVAGRACLRPVLAKKWEAGEIMIKPHAAGPAIGIMTATALVAESAFVGIVLGVARTAFSAQFQFIGRLCMACFTARQRVLSGQRELGHGIVIETDHFPIG